VLRSGALDAFNIPVSVTHGIECFLKMFFSSSFIGLTLP